MTVTLPAGRSVHINLGLERQESVAGVGEGAGGVDHVRHQHRAHDGIAAEVRRVPIGRIAAEVADGLRRRGCRRHRSRHGHASHTPTPHRESSMHCLCQATKAPHVKKAEHDIQTPEDARAG